MLDLLSNSSVMSLPMEPVSEAPQQCHAMPFAGSLEHLRLNQQATGAAGWGDRFRFALLHHIELHQSAS